jgi:hypothetical protein
MEIMSNASQKRALKNYRKRLNERGVARFEVLGLTGDRELLRALARRLTHDTAEAREIRLALQRTMAGEAPPRGRILAALRRSPLVGADLQLDRHVTPGREVDL